MQKRVCLPTRDSNIKLHNFLLYFIPTFIFDYIYLFLYVVPIQRPQSDERTYYIVYAMKMIINQKKNKITRNERNDRIRCALLQSYSLYYIIFFNIGFVLCIGRTLLLTRNNSLKSKTSE